MSDHVLQIWQCSPKYLNDITTFDQLIKKSDQLVIMHIRSNQITTLLLHLLFSATVFVHYDDRQLLVVFLL